MRVAAPAVSTPRQVPFSPFSFPAQGLFYFVAFCTYGVGLWYASRLVRESNDANAECTVDPTVSGCFSGGVAVMSFFAVQLGMEQVGSFLPSYSVLPTPSFLLLPSYSFLPTPSWRPRLDAYPCAVQVGLIFPVWATITTAAVAASRLYEVIDEATAADATDQGARSSAPADDGGGIVLQPDSVRGDICFKNVTFAYPSRPNDVILRDFSLAITGGTSTALVGDSGSGKSTLLQLILRMYEPQAGEVTLDGVNVKDINLDSLRSVFGLVAQVCVRSKHTTVLRAARRSLGWSS